MTARNADRDRQVLEYMRRNAGREVRTRELTYSLGVESSIISRAMQRAQIADRRLIQLGRGVFVYRGSPSAAPGATAFASAGALLGEALGVEDQGERPEVRVLAPGQLVAAIDRLTAAVEDQTQQFVMRGILMR